MRYRNVWRLSITIQSELHLFTTTVLMFTQQVPRLPYSWRQSFHVLLEAAVCPTRICYSFWGESFSWLLNYDHCGARQLSCTTPDSKSRELSCFISYNTILIQSSLAITLSPGGIFWDRGISEARYRFCRQVFFFNLVYIFWLQIAWSFMYFATMYFYHSLCLLYIYSYLFYYFIKA